MASKNGESHYPCVRTMRMGAAASGISGDHGVIDTAAFLSKVNRRLYRQGRYYTVKIDVDVDEDQLVEVYALRDDWAVHKAFQEAYDAYLENNADERAALKTKTARWEDFRVQGGYSDAFTLEPRLFTENGVSTRLTAGEFELSTVTDTTQQSRTFTWAPTGTATKYSILGEYALAGNAAVTPATPETDGPYANIRNELDQNQLVDLQEHGNQAPYDNNGINTTTPWTLVGVLGSSPTAPGVQKLSTGFFTAPCGLVVIRNLRQNGGIAADKVNESNLSITVKAGDYKGVHAPSMLE